LLFQCLLIKSNFSRCLAIREITQISFVKRLSGVDGKVSLNFVERFALNKSLKLKFYMWDFDRFKEFLFFRKDGNVKKLKVSTVSDRIWQTLLKYIFNFGSI